MGKSNTPGEKKVPFWKKPMPLYIFNRIWHSAVTMLLIIIAVFLLLRLTPKERYINPATLQKIPIAQRELYKESVYKELGLDKPIHIQLLRYLRQILPIPTETCVSQGFNDDYEQICNKTEVKIIDLGNSLIYQKNIPVVKIIKDTFPLSFKLTMIATFFAYLIGYPLGVLMAKYKDKLVDKVGNFYIVMTMAVPALIFYYIWLILSMKLGFKSVFRTEDWTTWVTPIWAITFLSIANQALWVRRYMVDEMNSDYVKFARSKGLSENKIMFKHIFRNAAVPLVRNIPAAIIYAVVGSYFVEQLWGIPGSGRVLITALQVKDTTLVQGMTIIYSLMSMAAFLLGDIVTVFFDPRISLEKNK